MKYGAGSISLHDAEPGEPKPRQVRQDVMRLAGFAGTRSNVVV